MHLVPGLARSGYDTTTVRVVSRGTERVLSRLLRAYVYTAPVLSAAKKSAQNAKVRPIDDAFRRFNSSTLKSTRPDGTRKSIRRSEGSGLLAEPSDKLKF